jgi:hypothetical protein
MKLTKKGIAAAAVLMAAGLGSTANATPMDWVNTKNLNVLISDPLEPVQFTHTLDNFNPGADTISSYQLVFNLFDDHDSSKWEIEAAVFSQPDYLIDTLWFDLSGTETAGWSLAGRAQLNASGSLSVAITSLLGDFYLGSSTLIAHGDKSPIPEPGTLALFGAALFGFGLMRRKRQAL